jgi:hypothetical protein
MGAASQGCCCSATIQSVPQLTSVSMRQLRGSLAGDYKEKTGERETRYASLSPV